jgi:hypothetical protein
MDPAMGRTALLHRKRVQERVRTFEPGTVVANQYRVLEQLGDGVEGVVYRVWDQYTRTGRALKFFFDEEKIPFFAGLAKKMINLQHPNIVQVFGVGHLTYRRKPVYFLEMECVEGPLLSDYIRDRRGRRLPLFEALGLFADVVQALSFAHRLGYVHEDLHSDNVILQGVKGMRFRRHTAKLNDFFPRGRRGARILKRQDVKALGRLLFEMLTGRLEYRSRSLEGMAPEVAGIIRDCYRRSPRGFADAQDLEKALRDLQWL